jgi:methanogenic corrinoid protein MtbC1
MSLSYPSTTLIQRYLKPLLEGDRAQCRQVIEHAFFEGATAHELMTQLLWPVMEMIQTHYREDQITQSTLNLATRLNRSIADQVSSRLAHQPPNNRKTLIFCGADEPEELGGQITSDLFEADGWTTRFAGGGVPDDEVLKLIGEYRPHLLVMFGTLPSGVPAVRKLIDYLREVNSCPEMQIMCCGGIYKRAEGLAEEIGADLYAPDGEHAVQVANAHPSRKATVDQQTVGRTRRIRKAAARKAASAQRQMVKTRVGSENDENE